jgi:hypothetical protein
MNISPCVSSASPYEGHRFPAEIISHCVWLYFRFSLSFRDVEEMMASAVSWSPTKRFGNGVRSSDSRTPNACVQGEGTLATGGISMKSFLRFRASCSIYGAPSIRTAMCSTSSFVATEQTGRQEVLSQAIERTSVRPTCDHHRQTPQLCGGQGGNDAFGGAPTPRQAE